MAQRTIHITTVDDRLAATERTIGYAGEHNATILQVHLSDDWTDESYQYLLKFGLRDDVIFSDYLTPPIEYPLPQALMKEGTLYVQLRAYAGTKIIRESEVKSFRVAPSVKAPEKIENALAGLLDFAVDQFYSALTQLKAGPVTPNLISYWTVTGGNGVRVNWFDKTKVSTGYIYDGETLQRWASGIAGQSDWIPTTQGDVVRVLDTRTAGANTNIVYKNEAGVIFAGYKKPANGGVLEFVTPAGAVSCSVAFIVAEIDRYMVVINAPYPDTYIPYEELSGEASYTLNNAGIQRCLEKIIDRHVPASVYNGKKLSVLGDSISTFKGYIPAGNACYYDGSNYGVASVEDTWWGKTMNALGMELCVNESWSGSRVTTLDGKASAGCMERCQKLHTADKTPDVVIVYMGTNDLNYLATQMGAYDGSQPFPTDTMTFREAYAVMLNKILTAYPGAEIWICTLVHCERQGSVGFPERNPTCGATIKEFNTVIKDMSDLFGVGLIDLNKCGITYQNLSLYAGDYNASTKQGLHPNAAGHSLIARQVIKTLDPVCRLQI